MKIAIIGAGASGLFLATLLEKLDVSYTIYNYGKVGNKILASGNGKCNIGNAFVDDEKYFSNPLAISVLGKQKELFSYLKELKIYTKEDDMGRMYPISESSLSVLNALLRQIHHPIVDEQITKIEKRRNQYYLNSSFGPYDKVIVACGSPAGYRDGFKRLELLNHMNLPLKRFTPSLVGIRTSLNVKPISGVRIKCRASLYQQGRNIHSECGEVIFKDSGISGICIMNISSFYNHLEDKEGCYIRLNLVDRSYDDYISVLPPKLLTYIEQNRINPLEFDIPILGVYDYEFAQVCSGGVSTEAVSLDLKYINDPGIYFAGEVLDVDGVCGGYNLMFVFCCSLVIYEDIQNEILNSKL